MVRSLLPIGVALIGATSVLAADSIPTCSLTQKCPESAPCCSQYGQCGVGAYCLGGCDPRMSFSLDSCAPEPQCVSRVMKMNSLDRIVDVSEYLGDSSKADWVAQGTPLVYNNEAVLLTMPANSVGTVLSSTGYMWYGNVKATFKTSRGAGVVTAFILLSDVKDEIDYEFVGTELNIAQTNYYFQGILDWHNSGNISLSDTYENYHTYEIQWTPDSITWLVDGQVGRVQKKSDTWNATANQWNFPQTPSRVELSIWPGGAPSNAPGTVQWAGGPIDWNSADIKNYGYDFATFTEVEIQCYNASSAPGTNNAVSYTYNNWLATNNTVVNGDKNPIMKNFENTGLDMTSGPDAGSSSTSSAAGSKKTNSNTVPGGTSNGPGNSQGNGDSSSGSGSGSGSNSGGSSTGSSSGCSTTGFSQSCDNGNSGSSSKSDGGRIVGGERIISASAFAVVVALGAMMVL
ncbi:cell wall glucanase (Utr2) [Sporothrix schenckii 1099-18]|uniref:Crh-like protein n=1 Tax=Sporothrix schenckii 1099-18 TaxID=1397361 RepID=A0A0F2LWP8_SPOSC|nr:cell wall glucanase (Utr2) [Sporothrix schenckii 1099-18]KJR81897.1 cell wall glucanase (Utr2) [Sporothrix schenckii 1099-18]